MFEAREPRSSEGKNLTADLDEDAPEATDDEMKRHRHSTLMSLLEYESERQSEERLQMQIDEDYNDHLQWRPEDARILMERGQAPLVFNEGRQTIDWLAGTEKRMRKDYKILPREPDDEQGAELKTKLVKYTDDVNETQWHRSKAFKQAVTAGLSWLEEGVNPDPESEIIYSGMEDWRNIFRDSHSRNVDYNTDARYLFRRRIIDLDILFFGDTIVEEEELRVPHPNVPFRAYALVPLLEIAPDFQHPTLKKTVTQLHESLSKPELVYLYGTRGDKETRS